MALWAVASAPGGQAWAHGVWWEQTGAEPARAEQAVTLAFAYADQTPMAYAQVKVFSPADAVVEHQNARSDRRGVFAFVPDAPGRWSFSCDDGMGHLAAGFVDVAPPASAEASQTAGQDVSPVRPSSGGSPHAGPLRTALGLSLILNLALAATVFRRRRTPKKP
ncbi:MAG: DUF4198 domain-containing protein [Deltaproteobacteria bacterium]|nr:DUF4198 domain-containing protein [Deltaproteobacteria bacterium]